MGLFGNRIFINFTEEFSVLDKTSGRTFKINEDVRFVMYHDLRFVP
jgi:hypothetical protein